MTIGLAQPPSQPARASLVFELVGRENISNAIAFNTMVMNPTQVIGSALRGAMITAFGAAAVLRISTHEVQEMVTVLTTTAVPSDTAQPDRIAT